MWGKTSLQCKDETNKFSFSNEKYNHAELKNRSNASDYGTQC